MCVLLVCFLVSISWNAFNSISSRGKRTQSSTDISNSHSLMYLLQFHYVNILTHSHTQNTNHNLAKFSPINKCDKQTLSSLQCRSSDVSIWSIKCAQRDSHLFSDEAAFKIHDINHYQINDIICDGKTKTTRCAYSYRVAEIFFLRLSSQTCFERREKHPFWRVLKMFNAIVLKQVKRCE